MMTARRAASLCLAFLLLFFSVRAAAGELVPDLGQVVGIKRLKGPPAARELLKRNGFVVVPRFYHRIFSPYIQEGLPPFVTTDSLHRTFHVIFEEQIKKMETALAGEVAKITAAMKEHFAPHKFQARRLAPTRAQALWLASGYFSVAEHLLAGRKATRSVHPALAPELELIHSARGVAVSPLFGYPIDYSQFKPRGFYTETPLLHHYFRAMTWYGSTAFRLISDKETRAAELIAGVFLQNRDVRERWEKIDRIYTSLLAPPDDLTPREYATILSGMARARIGGDPFEWFKRAVGGLRDPKINSMVVPPEQMHRWKELTKGMRFFGKRYLPDSEVFMHLTLPAVPGRMFPSGLDVMAANGSARAAELLRADGAFGKQGYKEGFAKALAVLRKLKQAPQRSHYTNFLRLAETLWAPPPDKAPPFLKTAAYTDKNLLTALAAWASTRHTWQLQAKQSAAYAGMTGPTPPGIVEPNLPFFKRLDELVAQTVAILKELGGMDIARLERFRRLVAQLRGIAEKQLAGEPLVGNERRLLDRYGPAIAGLMYFGGNSWLSDRALPWMSLVADVHTEHLSRKTLQVATGGAMPIYVVVPHKGKHYLMVGGVYSYHEFLQPIAERLTDEAWRRRVHRGDLPPMPGWTQSFIPGRDVEALIERLRKGEVVHDLRFVSDPRIAPILKQALDEGELFTKDEARRWATRLYALKAGRDAIPFLMQLLDSPRPRDKSAASRALGELADARDIPMLKQAALEGKEDKARACVSILARVQGLEADDALVAILQHAPLPAVKRSAVQLLGWRADKDATPALLAAYPRAKTELRGEIIEALGNIWKVRPVPSGHRPRSPTGLSAEQELHYREQVAKLALSALQRGNRGLTAKAMKALAALQLDEAIPVLERLANHGVDGATGALIQYRHKKASRALARLLRVQRQDPTRCSDIISALIRTRFKEAAPTMIALLDDKRETHHNSRRVCDWAMAALAKFDPDGPGFWQPGDRNQQALDLQRDIWKLYLKSKDAGGPEKADPADAAAMAQKLLQLAQLRERSQWAWNPGPSIRWVLMARTCIAAAPKERRRDLSRDADALLSRLTRKEIRRIMKTMGYYHRDFGQFPPATPGAWERTVQERRYALLDRSRLDKQGRLCDPWGRPYRYHNPARHTASPIELYSVGPNGRDEGGNGDDIMSEGVPPPPKPRNRADDF